MTPVQRITLTCRQTSEHASRLIGWLGHDQSYALQHRGLRDEIEGALGRLADIRHAVDLPPSVGIAGGSGAGKTELIAGLASLRQQALVAEFSGGQIDLNVVDAVLPAAGHDGIGLVLRFSSVEGPVAPKGLPVRLLLLSQTDLVRILARGFHTHFPVAHHTPPTAARIAEAFALAERALIAQSVTGLSARDILDLRDHLHGFYPESATLRVLSAAGYWEQLGELAAHLPELERRRLLALLWSEEPSISRLFARLSDALERLGHATDVFAPIDALATKERGTGWVVPHPRTVVAAATLQALGHGIDEKLRVAGRYGQIVEVERAALAGLAAELPMRLAAPQMAALKPAQILEFPSAPALVDFDPAETEAAGNGLSGIAALFAHVKAGYLLERACQRHDITSLVVCVDPLASDDDSIAASIAEWIETTQGQEPHQRERLQTGLFVVGTKLDQLGQAMNHAAPGAEATREAAQRWGDRLGVKLADEIGAGQDWPLEWTPGRAFRNIFLLQRPEHAPAAAGPGTSLTVTRLAATMDGLDAETVLKAPAIARHIDNPVSVWSGATVETDGGIGYLLASLTPAAQPAAKHRQLNTHLVDLRRRLRSRLLRLHLSNDPSQIGEWRRQLSIVAQGRLDRVEQADRMHILQTGLGVTEAELSVLYFGVLNAAPQSKAGSGNLALSERLAVITVEYWLQSIRQVARSSRFCRSAGLSQPVLQHIVDEISIGAVRFGLASQLTETFHRAANAPTERPLAAPFFAAASSRLIGRYVERLTLNGDAGRWGTATASRAPARVAAPPPLPGQRDVAVGTSLAQAQTVPAANSQNRGYLTQAAFRLGAGRLGAGQTSAAAFAAGTPAAAPSAYVWDDGATGLAAGSRRAGRDVAIARAGAASGGAAANGLGASWAQAYGALVEANIAAAAHLTGGADRDRELGELLAGFLSSPLEVDP
jgi:hypothetical protein